MVQWSRSFRRNGCGQRHRHHIRKRRHGKDLSHGGDRGRSGPARASGALHRRRRGPAEPGHYPRHDRRGADGFQRRDGPAGVLWREPLHPTLPSLVCFYSPHRSPCRRISPAEAGFRALLAEARERYDEILIDSPAGLGAGFRLATCDADRAIVVAVSDPSSLRDAQRVVSQLGRIKTAHLVVNRVRPRLLRRQGVTIDDAMDTAGLPLLGLVPEDANVILAGQQRPARGPVHPARCSPGLRQHRPPPAGADGAAHADPLKNNTQENGRGTTANFLHPYFRVSPRPHSGGGSCTQCERMSQE